MTARACTPQRNPRGQPGASAWPSDAARMPIRMQSSKAPQPMLLVCSWSGMRAPPRPGPHHTPKTHHQSQHHTHADMQQQTFQRAASKQRPILPTMQACSIPTQANALYLRGDAHAPTLRATAKWMAGRGWQLLRG